RVEGIVEVEVPFDNGQTESSSELDHRFAADTGEDVLLTGREHCSATYQEDVATHALSQIAIRVEKHRPGFRVAGLHLEIRRNHVQIVVRLHTRGKRFGRSASNGR